MKVYVAIKSFFKSIFKSRSRSKNRAKARAGANRRSAVVVGWNEPHEVVVEQEQAGQAQEVSQRCAAANERPRTQSEPMQDSPSAVEVIALDIAGQDEAEHVEALEQQQFEEQGTVHVAEAVEVVAPVEVLESVAPVEALDPVAPVETVEPVEAPDPVAPVETVELVEAVEPVAPVEAVEPVAPLEALHSIMDLLAMIQFRELAEQHSGERVEDHARRSHGFLEALELLRQRLEVQHPQDDDGALQHYVETSEKPLSSADVTRCSMCTVCLESFEVAERGVTLPCRHSFHRECLLGWVQLQHSTCPVCRKIFLSDDSS